MRIMRIMRIIISSSSSSVAAAITSIIISLLALFHNNIVLTTFSMSLPYVQYLYPNATFAYLHLVDNNGCFLASASGLFEVQLSNPYLEGGNTSSLPNLYVFHVPSRTAIWYPVEQSYYGSNSSTFSLTADGIKVTADDGTSIWSTPELHAPVASLMLQETGNLVLLDTNNVSLWETFKYPSDTIVSGQTLELGQSLVNGAAEYRLTVSRDDAMLQWDGQTYWTMSRDLTTYKLSNAPVTGMKLNASGLFLFSADDPDENVTVIQLKLAGAEASFVLARLEASGKFVIWSWRDDGPWVQEFAGPDEDCRLPFICGELGICSPTTTTGSSSGNKICSCPSGFRNTDSNSCLPAMESSYSLPSMSNNSCSSTNADDDDSSITYLGLDSGMDYFALGSVEPSEVNVSLSVCRDLCSKRPCNCSGFFHEDSSGHCYLLEGGIIGSLFLSSESIERNRTGYVKATIAKTTEPQKSKRRRLLSRSGLIIVVLVLSFSFLLLAITFLVFRIHRRRRKRSLMRKTRSLMSLTEEERSYGLGLPLRFRYDELVAATGDFTSPIGSGGFGDVYRGTLGDGSVVAVKKMKDSMGSKGNSKESFRAEIEVIGSVHHTNLVRLRGFCAEAGQRLLVLDFISRGSLGTALFGGPTGVGPLLSWNQRFEIALGAAKGLAYLHGECGFKIIHCDIKPENILLTHNLQAKISDFGISKLIGPEDSSGRLTTMRGTLGYLAPEWLISSSVDDKMDVYSYGMVLLEIVGGRRNWTLQVVHSSSGTVTDDSISTGTDRQPDYFPLLALEMHRQGRYLELVDPRLQGQAMSAEEVKKLVRVALCCLHMRPALRPTMASVVRMLTGEAPLSRPRVDELEYLQRHGGSLSTVQGIHQHDSTAEGH